METSKKYVVRYTWTSKTPDGLYPYNTKSCIVNASNIKEAEDKVSDKVPEKCNPDFTITNVFGPLAEY